MANEYQTPGVIWGDSENLGSKPAWKTEGVDGREGVVIVATTNHYLLLSE